MNCDFSVNKDTLTFQWHITSRCNLRCKHCYQESYDHRELEYSQLMAVIDQYKDLLKKLNRKGHINITGGEPFIREDFFSLLEVLNQNHQHFSFGILTNGSFIDQAAACRLKNLNPAFVQISIEGDEEIHNSIRGEGNLERVLQALKCLRKNDIKTLVSFTAHRGNYKTFPAVAGLCRRNGVFKLWTDRMVPFGNAESIKASSLNPQETWEFFNIVNQCRAEKNWRIRNRTIIELKRSLQFLADNSFPYTCKAGESLITLLEDGTVLPCRRLPIVAGNIKESSLMEIYFESPTLKELRSEVGAPGRCSRCSYFILCRGGARCISYAVTGEYLSRDPGCPIVW
ncbi:MAG: radical SAM protein [Clostridia bacterium]|nr:radical SAM protein [Clostridia bacterium]